VAGTATGTKTLDRNETGVGESGRTDKALYQAFPKQAGDSVLVQSRTLEARDSRFQAAVKDVSERVDGVGHVSDV
jgi:hypothetical protein